MPAPFLDVPDVDEDWKSFLIGQPNLAPLHGGRVYFRIQPSPIYPLLRIYRAGGGKLPGEPSILNIRFAVEVLANQINAAAYAAVRQITGVLESVVNNLDNVVSGGTLFQNGIVTSVADKPDPDNGWPGKVADCLITCRSTTL